MFQATVETIEEGVICPKFTITTVEGWRRSAKM